MCAPKMFMIVSEPLIALQVAPHDAAQATQPPFPRIRTFWMIGDGSGCTRSIRDGVGGFGPAPAEDGESRQTVNRA